MERRQTKNKKLILTALKRHHILSAKELSELFPDIDFSTIYRNLKRFVDDGLVREVKTGSETVSYEKARDSHDHFVCNSCEDVKEIKIESSYLQKYLPRGYQINLGQNIIKGTCNKCS